MPCLWWCWCRLCAGSWWDDAVAVCGKGKGGVVIRGCVDMQETMDGGRKKALALPTPCEKADQTLGVSRGRGLVLLHVWALVF